MVISQRWIVLIAVLFGLFGSQITVAQDDSESNLDSGMTGDSTDKNLMNEDDKDDYEDEEEPVKPTCAADEVYNEKKQKCFKKKKAMKKGKKAGRKMRKGGKKGGKKPAVKKAAPKKTTK